MEQIFSIVPNVLDVNLQNVKSNNSLPSGYTAMVATEIEGQHLLYTFNNQTLLTDVYSLTNSSDTLAPVLQGYDGLNGKAWTILRQFTLGDKPYLMSYEATEGNLAFYEIKSDYSLSKPYIFMNKRSWPTQGFSEVTPIVITGLLYVLGYDKSKGTVAIFSLDVISKSPEKGVPPLNMLNVWYHQWAAKWENFAFFTLGQSNFFFKINKGKLNVNIDHILDNPSVGSVEIGSYLQHKMPNALEVILSASIPWENGEPYLATLDGTTNLLDIYRIHADCQGWTKLGTTQTNSGTIMISYRIEDTSYILLY